MSFPETTDGLGGMSVEGFEGAGEFRAFVGGISWRYSSEDLKEVFQKYGAVSARVMVDKFTNRSRGFGFVTFADEAGLLRAIEEVHGTELDGKLVSVKSAVPMNATGGGTEGARSYDRRTYDDTQAVEGHEGQEFKAFVGGISWQYNSDQLRDVFRKFSPADAQVIMDQNGRSRGFGFVTFRNDRSLVQAIEEMNNAELDGKCISVTRAVPRDQTLPGTPAAALAHGSNSYRQSYGRDAGRYRGYDRMPYQRGYDREMDLGYERAPVLVRAYDRGFDRRGYGYGSDRDPYYRDIPVYDYPEYDRQPRGYADSSYNRAGYAVDRYRVADRGVDRNRAYPSRPGPYDRHPRR